MNAYQVKTNAINFYTIGITYSMKVLVSDSCSHNFLRNRKFENFFSFQNMWKKFIFDKEKARTTFGHMIVNKRNNQLILSELIIWPLTVLKNTNMNKHKRKYDFCLLRLMTI